MCAYCLLKDDMPFVSGSYMIEVNDHVEKSVLLSYLGFWSGNLFLIAPFPDLCLLVPVFQKAKKNGSNDFNPEVTEK